MAEHKRVGLLVGRERSFPDALCAAIERLGAPTAEQPVAVTAGLAEVDITRIDAPPEYAVLVDRISHDIPSYQPYLKLAALAGTHVVNNPFWRIADDKYFDTALARALGVAVPKTAVLPSKSYGPDTTEGSLRNLRFPLGWEALARDFGLPLYLKPHWGGGWRDVYRVRSLEELWAAYDKTGRLTMLVQEEIAWTQYVRCLCIGRDEVLPTLWDPRLPHHERYKGAARSMAPLGEELRARVVSDASKLCRALGYDMNTVEFAVRDGVPYAIDIMNTAPDFDASSLGEEQFAWVVERMAGLCVRLARSGPSKAAERVLREGVAALVG